MNALICVKSKHRQASRSAWNREYISSFVRIIRLCTFANSSIHSFFLFILGNNSHIMRIKTSSARMIGCSTATPFACAIAPMA